MKEYLVVQGVNEQGGALILTKLVNDKLGEGWQCEGGICFAPGVYSQAMTREKVQKKAVK